MKLKNDWDVIVFGGGAAGIVAAIQAGRAGCRVLLVEKNACLGGVTVNSRISYPGLYHAWGKQVIAGIGWELVLRVVAEGRTKLPDFQDLTVRPSRHQIPVNPVLYSMIADDMITAAGGELLFHAMPAAVAFDETDQVWNVTLCLKEGLTPVRTRMLIDCTGDANVVRLAGLPLRIPEANQPATLSFRMGGYDLEKVDRAALKAAFGEAVAAGTLQASDACWRTDQPDPWYLLAGRGGNSNHIPTDSTPMDSVGRSALEVAARRSVYRLVRWFQTQPGLEQLTIEAIALETGVRETATIIGHETITVEDYSSSRVWPESVCYSYYTIDLHGLTSQEWQYRVLPPGTVATIPRGALVPANGRQMLAAGRCVSSDRLANSGLRVQGSCMAMGQAAGAIAAVAVREKVDPMEASFSAVRELLLQHGAILPPKL